jgi:hypothetical protein
LQQARAEYTLRANRAQALRKMLEHLIDFDPPAAFLDDVAPLTQVSPAQVLDAQVSTADWLAEMGAPTADDAAASAAQKTFATLIQAAPPAAQRQALLTLNTPAAVRHLTGMLTAYDWAFVEQAKELRGYAVAQILEETKNPDARIRLRALEMLGKVTEVALFTDRVEVKRTNVTDNELDAKIKEKLSRFMGVVDVTPEDTTPIPSEEDGNDESSDASA